MFRSFKDLTGAAPCCRLRAFSSILVLLACTLPAVTGCPQRNTGVEAPSGWEYVKEGDITKLIKKVAKGVFFMVY